MTEYLRLPNDLKARIEQAAQAQDWARAMRERFRRMPPGQVQAFGLAGARIGTLIADARIVSLLRSVLPPYAIAQPCIEAAQQALAPAQQRLARERVAAIVRERARLSAALAGLAGVTHVWPSDANFLLVEFHEPARALSRLREARLLVRDFRDRPGLERALRITVGSPEQNDRLVRSLAC